MFALRARAPPSSVVASAHRRGSKSGSRRPSVVVRVAEFERKTADKKANVPPPPAVDSETPLDIDNDDGGDAFAELVALNRPKQSVNRPQKVRFEGIVIGGNAFLDKKKPTKIVKKRQNAEKKKKDEWLDANGMPTVIGGRRRRKKR